MYLTVKQQPKHLSKEDYRILRELCHAAKNLTNQAVYNIRQQFFATGRYLSYAKNYEQLKTSEHYRFLNSNMAQQILKEVDGSFQSFFGKLKLAKAGGCSHGKCRLPGYLPKDGFATLIIGYVRITDNRLVIPYSNTYRKSHPPVTITLPPVLHGKKIKEIRILPKADARFFEIQYTYEADCIDRKLNNSHALALDFGVDNLITAVSDTGSSFIVDGRRLKSVNQWYNKKNAFLQSVKNKQGCKKTTKRQALLARKRNNRVNDYLSKAARMVTDYCIANEIGILVAGYSPDFQRYSGNGKRNNQTFVNIPFGKLLKKLEYLCELNGIRFVEQEESYTSKASFFDKDPMPVYGKPDAETYAFSGRRVKRGLYRMGSGKTLNADVNGALNILRKSNVVSLKGLYHRGEVDTPVRIRIA